MLVEWNPNIELRFHDNILFHLEKHILSHSQNE